MKNFMVIGGVGLALIGGAIVIGALVVGSLWVSANNTEVSLRNRFTAQQKTNESSFDKTWKVIQQSAQVSERERETFREAYVEIMQATKGVAGEGALASFFTQAKVDIAPDLFLKLMTTIESQRESFHRDQQRLLDIKREHDDVLTRFPSSLFVGSRKPLNAKIVTSGKTDEAFGTGQENDVDLFGGK